MVSPDRTERGGLDRRAEIIGKETWLEKRILEDLWAGKGIISNIEFRIGGQVLEHILFRSC